MSWLPSPARGQDARSTLADIRAFDFRNHVYTDLGHTRVRVRDGHWEPRRRTGDFNQPFLAVIDVQYGDLTGDGCDEAVVLLEQCGGGTGHWTFGYVYSPSAGTPRRLGALPAGDRADGGIGDVRIEGGRLLVERFGHDVGGAMDVEWIETEAWIVRDGVLRYERSTNRRAYIDMAWGAFGPPMRGRRSPPVRFLRGGTRATLRGSVTPERPDRWALRPRSGRALEVDLSHTRAEGIRVEVRGHDGAALGTLESGQRVRVSVAGPGESTLVVTSSGAHEYWMEVAWVDAAPAPE